MSSAHKLVPSVRTMPSALALVVALMGCGSSALDAVVIDPASLTRDLVAHWTFDEGTGNTVGDSSGNGYEGVLTGGTWNPSGRFGGALAIAAGDYVTVSNFPQAKASWTVSVWTRTSAVGLAANTTDFATIIGTEMVFAGGWQIHLDNRPNRQRFDAAYWAGMTVDDYVVVSCGCIETDFWTHLTAVWDGDLARMTLYREDQVVGQTAMPSAISDWRHHPLHREVESKWSILHRRHRRFRDLESRPATREITTLSRQPPAP